MKPGSASVLLAALWTALGLAVSAGIVSPVVWTTAGVVLAILLAVDLILVRTRPAPVFHRIVPTVLPLGDRASVRLHVENPGRSPLRLEIHDHHPADFRQEGLPHRLVLTSGDSVDLTYTVTPRTRGDARFGTVDTWMRSPLRTWYRRVHGAVGQTVRVYPNFRSIGHYNLLASGGHTAQLGIHKQHRRGVGLEFHQLREYRMGDPPARIDWRATSRHLKLISREYQDERNQRVVLLLDCGRRMWTRDGELSHLDRSLNAALLLAHVALKQGDSVGLVTFGAENNRQLAPRRSVRALDAILNATYDLAPSLYESDVAEALEQTASELGKRSLIVLISNLSDHQPENLVTVARTIRRRHLLLFASLRERVLEDIVQTEVSDLATAVRLGATYAYMRERERQLRLLRAEGIVSLDVLPSRLPAELASAYFSLKAQRLL